MSSDILFENHVIIYLFSETVLLLLNLIAFIVAIEIIIKWDFHASSQKQYSLEKKSYLVLLIILFSLYFKILLVPYFAYTIDNLSSLVPGAMCGAGVIGANEYGNYLLAIKILLLFLIGTWIIINSEDLKQENYPYTKIKFILFSLIFTLFAIEYIFILKYFSNISTQNSVQCCSVIFGLSGSNTLPFGLNTTMLLALFYILYILNTLFAFQKYSFALFISGLSLFYIGYLSLTNFFGTYIYELPTHICPFCMLQKDYYYIGYILWSLLFLGVFFSIINFILKISINSIDKNYYKYSFIFNTIFVILCTLYPIFYYIKNGVWL